MAKKRQEDSLPPALWKDTFSDLMNLLLCFFVLLFSMSSVDESKFEELAASLSAAFSVLPGGGSALMSEGMLVGSGASQLNELSDYYNNMGLDSVGDTTDEADEKDTKPEEDIYEQLQKEGLAQSEQMVDQIQASLENQNIASQVELSATSKYVVLSLSSGLLFDSGKAELKSEAIDLVDKISDTIKLYQDNIISVEGHTDNVPTNPADFKDNMILSQYRAYAVFSYMVYDKGFNANSITSIGRGEWEPVASNDTPEGRAQNRRVEIKIYNTLNS